MTMILFQIKIPQRHGYSYAFCLFFNQLSVKLGRRIIECVTGNENSILTVSSYLDGEYGIKDICLSVPTIVSSKGIDTILEVPFADEEIKALRHSADALKELAKQAGI